MIESKEISRFQSEGYAVYRAAFSPPKVEHLRDTFMRLRENGTYAHDDAVVDPEADDPLMRFPRLVNAHQWHAETRRWLLDRRVIGSAGAIAGDAALALQTMVYFKPPGSRGQALHQDKFFLRVRPGTTIAAWMALDHADEANGCMLVVPSSQDWPVLCAAPADTGESFTSVTVEDDLDAPARSGVLDTRLARLRAWSIYALRTTE